MLSYQRHMQHVNFGDSNKTCTDCGGRLREHEKTRSELEGDSALRAMRSSEMGH